MDRRRDDEGRRPDATGREERLAAAMRANLRRRKEQRRARDEATPAAGEERDGKRGQGEVEGPGGSA